jgi:threonine dehydrogenase-like Zn-dependent dehydrogenase
MPRAIVTADGLSYRIVEQTSPALGPADVRVRVEFAAPKHGTEKHALSGSAFDRKRWDPELRLFLPRDPAPPAAPLERGIGNMVVGRIEECGSAVSAWKAGDQVFGYGPIREEHQGPEAAWYPVGDLSPEDCVCVDPAHVAFVAVRDGNIRIGDHVAVYGLGAIGLMAVRIARAGGARRVFAVDPIAIRRECAVHLGAEAAYDPIECDAALEIKRATGGAGVDVAIETSGSGAALHDAIRCIRQCGAVVHVPWGPHDCAKLHLDEEFHLNRPTIVGSQAWSGWGCADRSNPLWTHERAFEAAIELFRAGIVSGAGGV